MFRQRQVFQRAEQPKMLEYQQIFDFYQQSPERCIERIVYLLSYQLILNENEGRFNFEEDVCPTGLRNIHIIFFPEGCIYLKVDEQKLKFVKNAENSL